MKTRYITEKDFLPVVITNDESHTEVEDGLFQIAYGVMKSGMTYDKIYDLIVRISKEQKSDVVKRFKLLAWKVEVEAIIKKLGKYDISDVNVVVVIPFTNYVEKVTYTMNQFQLVLYIINEILEKGDAQMEVIPNPSYDMPPKTIRALLVGCYYTYRDSHYPENMRPDFQYFNSLFFDEMIRRGITEFNSTGLCYDPETQEIEGGEYSSLSPSEYYNQPEMFFETMDWVDEKWTKLKIKNETVELNDALDSKPKSGKNGYIMGTVGTVFFMLKDLSQVAVEKKNKKKLVALMNYILGNEPNIDTPRSYVDKLLEVSEKSHSFKFYDSVKENLIRFGFGVPDVIKKGYEKQRK